MKRERKECSGFLNVSMTAIAAMITSLAFLFCDEITTINCIIPYAQVLLTLKSVRLIQFYRWQVQQECLVLEKRRMNGSAKS